MLQLYGPESLVSPDFHGAHLDDKHFPAFAVANEIKL